MDKTRTDMTASDGTLLVEFLHRRGHAAGVPVSGNFELTCRCNFNCKMCYVHQQHIAQEELTAAEWIQLGKEVRDRGMLFLLLTGGEPFLRKDFKEIYLGLRRLGLMVSINTNASLLTDDILEALQEAPPTNVNVTLYGGNSGTYGRLCGVAAYDTVTKNILRLKNAGILVKLNATITPDNASDIDAIYQFGKDHDIAVRATSYLYPPVRRGDGERMESVARFTPKEAAECMLKFREHRMSAEQLRQMAAQPQPPERDCGEDGGPMRCRAGRTSFWVTWDGRLLPCGMFPTDGYLLREMGFDEAWRRVRSDVAQVVMPSACSVCAKRDHCGVCAASCIAESGDTRIRPAYVCEMTDWLDRLIQEKYT